MTRPDNLQPNSHNSYPRFMEQRERTDVLFLCVGSEPSWLQRVVSRLEAHGWSAEQITLSALGDESNRLTRAEIVHLTPRILIQTAIESESSAEVAFLMAQSDLCYHIPEHDIVCTTLPCAEDETSREPQTPYISPKEITRVASLVQNLIETTLRFKRQPDPRLERVRAQIRRELDETLSAHPSPIISSIFNTSAHPRVTSTLGERSTRSDRNLDYYTQCYVERQPELISLICDSLSDALSADLAYGSQQPQEVLKMYLELHQTLHTYVIGDDLINVESVPSVKASGSITSFDASDFWSAQRSESSWGGVWEQLRSLLIVKPGSPLTAGSAQSDSTPLLKTLDALLESLSGDSCSERERCELQDSEIKVLINHYRVRWEHLLIARHTARALCVFDLEFDALVNTERHQSQRHQSQRHHPMSHIEVAEVMMNVEDQVAVILQSGYLRGALEVYRYVSHRLFAYQHAQSDASLAPPLCDLLDQLKASDSSSELNQSLRSRSEQRVTDQLDTQERIMSDLEIMKNAVRRFIEHAIPCCHD